MDVKWIVLYYTVEQRQPDFFNDLNKLLDHVVALTKRRAKFTVYELGKCVGDYS